MNMIRTCAMWMCAGRREEPSDILALPESAVGVGTEGRQAKGSQLFLCVFLLYAFSVRPSSCYSFLLLGFFLTFFPCFSHFFGFIILFLSVLRVFVRSCAFVLFYSVLFCSVLLCLVFAFFFLLFHTGQANITIALSCRQRISGRHCRDLIS